MLLLCYINSVVTGHDVVGGFVGAYDNVRCVCGHNRVADVVVVVIVVMLVLLIMLYSIHCYWFCVLLLMLLLLLLLLLV